MKRVLQVLSGLSAGGAETLVVNLYRNVDAEKVHFDFCVFGNEDGIYAEEVKRHGGRIFLVPSIGKVGVKGYIAAMERIIIENGPYDVIHSHIDYLSSFALYAARRCKIPVRIAHSHSSGAIGEKKKINPLFIFIMGQMIKRNATTLCACSQSAADFMFGRGGERNAVIINNGIDLHNFSNTRKFSREDIVACLGINVKSSTKILAHIGRYVEAKNHEGLLEIFDQFHQRETDSILLLVGDGKLRCMIEDKIRQKKMTDYVFVLGNRTEIPEILSISDALVLPSLYEGIPLTLIEAQAMGVPCVVSDRVNHDADLGLHLLRYAPIDNINEYVMQIKAALVDGKKIDCADVIKEKGYDISSNMKRLYNLYGVE